MTATPHNGKEEDFQLFMGLLDADRFEGRFREGVHKADPSDMMRRLTKEELVRLDGSPLFPERQAYTVSYRLSPGEAALYGAVTRYVQEEMNRADRIGGATTSASRSRPCSGVWRLRPPRSTNRSNAGARVSRHASRRSGARPPAPPRTGRGRSRRPRPNRCSTKTSSSTTPPERSGRLRIAAKITFPYLGNM